MTHALVALLLSAASLHSDPASLVGGTQTAVQLRIDGVPEDAKVALNASTGTLGALTPAGAGSFTASLAAPSEVFPQLLFVHAVVRGKGEPQSLWLCVPVSGQLELHATTKPNAAVEITAGRNTVSGLRADEKGNVSSQITVPPGVQFAVVKSVDRLGNVARRQVPLDPPPLRRVHVDAVNRTSASWADSDATQVEAFVANADGTPVANAKLELKADIGTISPMNATRFSYRPPESYGTGAKLSARLLNGTSEPFTYELPLRAGPIASISVSTPTPSHLAGSPALSFEVVAKDAHGNLSDEPVPVSSDFGTVRGKLVEIPDAFGGRSELHLSARTGDVHAELSVALIPSSPARAKFVPSTLTLEEGGSAGEVRVEIDDAYENPIPRAQVNAHGVGLVVDAREGLFSVRAKSGAPEKTELQVDSGEKVLGKQPVTVEPASSWRLSVSPRAQAQPGGVGAALELGVQPVAALPIAVVGRAGVESSAGAFQGGLRFSHLVSKRLELQASVLAGVDRKIASESALSSTASAGICFGVGPGCAIAEGLWSISPRDDSRSGFGGAIGYVWRVH